MIAPQRSLAAPAPRRAGENGVAAVEMALVLPVLLLLLFGIIEIANILRIQLQLENVVSEAARYATMQETTAAQAESSVADLLASVTQSADSTAKAPIFSMTPATTTSCKETPCTPFVMKVTYVYHATNALMEPFFDNLQLTAVTKRISEPW